ncbi:T9SS type A sorting domain-containing protein, partial [Spirosoma sp.]|uniref:T9SS type A sorting domain-containing protein n=1 Tax=Spirosoma sp. TaxID=1899569 RepID=UPI003B3B94AE
GSVTATVSGPERMGFVIQLQQCAPNPASDPLSAVSGTILNSFDITYNSSLNRYEGIQKEGVSLGFATVRRLNIAATATQPSASTTVNTIGAYCVIFPNSNAEPQPEDDDFSEILTHTKTTSPLPVGLVSFSAEAQSNRTVLVKWVTSWEKANKGYIIERSKDLKNFEDIGRVTDVAGTTNSKSSYQFEDPNPYRGTSYYRLRQLDLSGGSETFKAESVVIDGRYGVYPNPVASHNFTLELDEPTTAVLHFYSASGSEISVSKSEPTELSTKVTPSAKLTSGVYVLTVEERGTTRKHRLVVQ